MSEVLDEEIISVLKEKYLLHHISSKFAELKDESLIYIYIRLLCIYDDVNKLPISNHEVNFQYECSTSNLKHIVKCLRPLGLSFLVTKLKDLLDKKKATRILFALHDRVSSKYGKTTSQRVRLVIKKELLAKTNQRRNTNYSKTDEVHFAENSELGQNGIANEKNITQEKWLGMSSVQENTFVPPLPCATTKRIIPGGWQIPRTPLKENLGREAHECEDLATASLPPHPPPAFKDSSISPKIEEKECNNQNLETTTALLTPPSEFADHQTKTDCLDVTRNVKKNLQKINDDKRRTYCISGAPATFNESSVTQPENVSPEFDGHKKIAYGITNETQHENSLPEIKDKRRTYCVYKAPALDKPLITDSETTSPSKFEEHKRRTYCLARPPVFPSEPLADKVRVPLHIISEENTVGGALSSSLMTSVGAEKGNLLEQQNRNSSDMCINREEKDGHQLSFIDVCRIEASSLDCSNGRIPQGRELPRTPPSMDSSLDQSTCNSETKSSTRILSKFVNENIGPRTPVLKFLTEVTKSNSLILDNEIDTRVEADHQNIKLQDVTLDRSASRISFCSSPLSYENSLEIFPKKKYKCHSENKLKENFKKNENIDQNEKQKKNKAKTEDFDNKIVKGTRKTLNEKKINKKINNDDELESDSVRECDESAETKIESGRNTKEDIIKNANKSENETNRNAKTKSKKQNEDDYYKSESVTAQTQKKNKPKEQTGNEDNVRPETQKKQRERKSDNFEEDSTKPETKRNEGSKKCKDTKAETKLKNEYCIKPETEMKQNGRKTKSKKQIDNLEDDMKPETEVKQNEKKTKTKKPLDNIEDVMKPEFEMKQNEKKAKSKKQIYNLEDDVKQNEKKAKSKKQIYNLEDDVKQNEKKTKSKKQIYNLEDDVKQNEKKTKSKKQIYNLEDDVKPETEVKQNEKKTKTKKQLDNIEDVMKPEVEVEQNERTKLNKQSNNLEDAVKPNARENTNKTEVKKSVTKENVDPRKKTLSSRSKLKRTPSVKCKNIVLDKTKTENHDIICGANVESDIKGIFEDSEKFRKKIGKEILKKNVKKLSKTEGKIDAEVESKHLKSFRGSISKFKFMAEDVRKSEERISQPKTKTKLLMKQSLRLLEEENIKPEPKLTGGKRKLMKRNILLRGAKLDTSQNGKALDNKITSSENEKMKSVRSPLKENLRPSRKCKTNAINAISEMANNGD